MQVFKSLLIILLTGGMLFAQSNKIDNFIQDIPGRQIYKLNKDWFYLEKNYENVYELPAENDLWQKINLPHTWNQFDNVDAEPGYRRDASWYHKNIFVPKLSYGQKIKLYFEGSNITTKVYVNNKFAGEHEGGYLGFEIDLSKFIIIDSNNYIKIRVDNSYNPNIIPSQKSDFCISGGIVRNLWLKILPPKYFNNFHAKISNVSESSAETEVEASLNCNSNVNVEITARLFNPDGREVSHKKITRKLIEGKNLISFNLDKLKAPELWSPDNPNLYTIKLSMMQNGELMDSTSDRIGYRWYEFKEHDAFFLNGKRFLIKGTHRHEDYAGYGAAVPDSLQLKDMKMIKEMGANYVRLAHYPQSPLVYKACDELGILVWDELPWCRGGMGQDEWKTNTKRLLEEQINQNYNHPSIIIWSLGNELNWLPDFPNGNIADSLDAFLKILNNIAHKIDPSRLTAVRKYEGAAKIVDIFSPSIWSGWYSGVYTNYQNAIEDAQKKYPHMVHMEFGGSSLTGRHTDNPITGEGKLNPDEWDEKENKVSVSNIASIGDWSENYIVDLFDWYLRFTMQSKTFSGSAQWAFKDFPTPLRPENGIPYINMKGLVDRAGNPKDAYYVFKSYWTDKPEFCYIESHTWNERSGPKDLKREICVYSNCQSVELFQDDKSLGIKEKDITKYPASGLTWQINFNSGANKLKAVGYNESKQAAVDTLTVNYTFKKSGIPDDIKLSSRKLNNGNYIIIAIVIDSAGQRCLDYNKRIYFSLNGAGKLVENLGTSNGSSIIDAANGKAQIEFKPELNKKATIHAYNQDFKGTYLTIE